MRRCTIVFYSKEIGSKIRQHHTLHIHFIQVCLEIKQSLCSSRHKRLHVLLVSQKLTLGNYLQCNRRTKPDRKPKPIPAQGNYPQGYLGQKASVTATNVSLGCASGKQKEMFPLGPVIKCLVQYVLRTSNSNAFGLCSSRAKWGNICRSSKRISRDSIGTFCKCRIAQRLVSLCICYILTWKVSRLFHVMLFCTRWSFPCQSRVFLRAKKKRKHVVISKRHTMCARVMVGFYKLSPPYWKANCALGHLKQSNLI